MSQGFQCVETSVKPGLCCGMEIFEHKDFFMSNIFDLNVVMNCFYRGNMSTAEHREAVKSSVLRAQRVLNHPQRRKQQPLEDPATR